MCRGKEVSRAKVILISFFDNGVDTILKGTCTRSPCEYWHPPECFSMKAIRDVKQGITVCSRIIRLTKNRTKSRQRATIPKKEEKATTKM